MKILQLIIDPLRISEKKNKRGAPRKYSNKSILKIFMVMVFLKISSLRSLERTLKKNPLLKTACKVSRTPSYRTLGRRLPKILEVIYPLVIQLLTFLTETGLISWHLASIDSTILQALGKEEQREWRDGKPSGKVLQKPTDKDAKWGYSAGKDEYIFGYKLHMIVLVKPLIIPLCWMVTSAAPNDTNFFKSLSLIAYGIGRSLSKLIIIFLGDKGYDSYQNRNFAVTLENARLVAPIRDMKGRMSGRRKIIDEFNHSPKGKRLLKRRSDVERLFEHFKDLFFVDPLPIKGKENVTAYLSVANLAYLSAVVYNIKAGRNPREIKSLIY